MTKFGIVTSVFGDIQPPTISWETITETRPGRVSVVSQDIVGGRWLPANAYVFLVYSPLLRELSQWIQICETFLLGHYKVCFRLQGCNHTVLHIN